MRMSGTVLAVVIASALVPHGTPTAEAAEKARSNLASGDIALLEQAFGSGRSTLKGKRTGKRGKGVFKQKETRRGSD